MPRALIVNCSPVRNGATARIAEIIADELAGRFEVGRVCIDDYRFAFCRGCRRCHDTGRCVLPSDGAEALMDAFERADVVVCVSPSYWADVPGQFKAFIDRCTPWCDTHEPHAALTPGKRGYAVALRTGPGAAECGRIVRTIEHFFGHLHIDCPGSLSLTGVEGREDVEGRAGEIVRFCETIL
ncbi:MAG: flavodoxin family protein [Clostridia bacterium]|nr:flavodoxin family protein [Clostridia bacterium]